MCFTLLLNPSRVTSFHTYILGSLIFRRMLDLWVYTYKPWGFVHISFKLFISSYDYVVQDLCILYVCQDLDFDLSRQHYSWIFNSHMTYVSIRNLGKGTRFSNPLKKLTFFLFILVWSIQLWDQSSSPNAFILFFLDFSLHFSLNGTKRMWDRTPTTSFTFYFHYF